LCGASRGPRVVNSEAVCLAKGFPQAPPHGELFDIVCDLADASPAVLPGLHALTLLSKVPSSPNPKACLSVADAAEYAKLKGFMRATSSVAIGGSALRSRAVVLPVVSTEHLLPRRLVLALHRDAPNTADGMVVLSQQRRVDLVASALLRQSGGDGVVDMTDPRSELRLLFRSLGEADAASLCFAVACGLPRDANASAGPAALGIAALGAGRFGGYPLAQAAGRVLGTAHARSPPGTQAAAAAVGGGGVGGAEPAFRYSLSHDGLFKFLGRLLRPLWFSPVVALYAAPEPSDQAGWKRPRLAADTPKLKVVKPVPRSEPPLAIGLDELDGLRQTLQALIVFMRQIYADGQPFYRYFFPFLLYGTGFLRSQLSAWPPSRAVVRRC